MDSLIFAINAVAPIILVVAIGYLLKKKGFMNAEFARAANKLVFRIFLPSMLFLNISAGTVLLMSRRVTASPLRQDPMYSESAP